MIKRKRTFIAGASIFLVLFLLGGSFIAFRATDIPRAEKQYKARNDSKSLVELCVHLTASKEYERQIQYIKELMGRMDFAEFSNSMDQISVFKKSDKKIIYQMMLTRYLEAWLHLDKPEQYLLEFPVIYKKYLNEKECFSYIQYSISDKLLSDKQLATVLTALNAHMEGEEKEIQLFNLDTQAAIVISQGDEVEYRKLNWKIDLLKEDLLQGKANA